MEKYPGWSARDNYAKHKKKRRKRDKIRDGGSNKCTLLMVRFTHDFLLLRFHLAMQFKNAMIRFPVKTSFEIPTKERSGQLAIQKAVLNHIS